MENYKIRSFGRVKSRKLGEKKIDIKDNEFPKYKLDINNIPNDGKIILEIGFGYGEHTIHQAKLNDCCIIGCETYINGVLALVKQIKEENISNIKIFNDDARLLLEKISNNSIDKVFILFPDPWPKEKQKKRRLINPEFLDLLKSKLKVGGTLFFASDIVDYVSWTYNFTKEKLDPLFDSLENCKIEPSWWIRTRYQEKAINEGRESYFLEFKNNIKIT